MSKVSDLSYDIEQLFIEGYSPRTISVILECPVELVFQWIEQQNLTEDQEDLVDTEYV
jgi:hypothetical protein